MMLGFQVWSVQQLQLRRMRNPRYGRGTLPTRATDILLLEGAHCSHAWLAHRSPLSELTAE